MGDGFERSSKSRKVVARQVQSQLKKEAFHVPQIKIPSASTTLLSPVVVEAYHTVASSKQYAPLNKVPPSKQPSQPGRALPPSLSSLIPQLQIQLHAQVQQQQKQQQQKKQPPLQATQQLQQPLQKQQQTSHCPPSPFSRAQQQLPAHPPIFAPPCPYQQPPPMIPMSLCLPSLTHSQTHLHASPPGLAPHPSLSSGGLKVPDLPISPLKFGIAEPHLPKSPSSLPALPSPSLLAVYAAFAADKTPSRSTPFALSPHALYSHGFPPTPSAPMAASPPHSMTPSSPFCMFSPHTNRLLAEWQQQQQAGFAGVQQQLPGAGISSILDLLR